MDLKNLLKLLENILIKFFENDSFLIENNSHEQAISHKLACYLEKELKNFLEENNYSVDIEYNRYGEDPKEFKGIASNFIDGKYRILDKDNNIICEYGRILLEENNFCLGIIEEGYSYFIGKKISDANIKIEQKGIKPDIIVHRRGKNSNGDNLLVFEVKKSLLNDKDIIKLKGLTDKELNFGYKYGVGLYSFNSNNRFCKIDIYKKGEILKKWLFNNGKITNV